MTYTSNLHLLNSEISPSNSSTYNTVNTSAIAVFTDNLYYLDSYISSYKYYNVENDANISITSDSLYLKIADTNILLTTTRTLIITSNSVKQVRIIKNATNFTLIYGTISIPSNSIYIIYDDNIISAHGKIGISDIYYYISGQPSIDTIYSVKRIIKNSILVGGKARANTATTSNLTIDIWLNTSKVGTIVFSAGSYVGIVSIFGTVYVGSSDTLYIKTQGIQDTTLASIGIVLTIVEE